MNLSNRRRDDIPFIGSDPEDMYYESESGKVFDMTENRFFPDFDSWWEEFHGFAFRSEIIMDDIREGKVESVKEWMRLAFLAGQMLGYEECAAFGINNVEDDV
jgi:hypothetical protein